MPLYRNDRLVLAFLIVLDQLRDLGICPDRLDQYNVAFVQEHAIRTVPFVAAPHQNVRNRFGLLVDGTLYVINVCQLWETRASLGQLTVIQLTGIEQDRGVRDVYKRQALRRARLLND